SFIEHAYEGTTFRQHVQLFLNDGGGRYIGVGSEVPPFTDRMVGRGAAFADYDADGDLDILITENNGPIRLWRNEQTLNRGVRVKLVGAPPVNRDGYGSVVTGWINGRPLERRVRGGASYL